MSYARFRLLAAALAVASPPVETAGGRFGFASDRSLMIAGASVQRALTVDKVNAEEWRPWNADGSYTVTGSTLTATGANNQAILNDARDKMFTLMDSAPNLLHRINLPPGTYIADFQDKEFGFGRRPVFGPNGGVILTSSTGVATDVVILGSPGLGAGGFSAACDGLILYKLTFARAENGGGGGDFAVYLEGTNATNGGRFIVDSCNFGAFWHPTKAAFDNASSWSRALGCNRAKQLTVRNCNFQRCHYQQYTMNARVYHSYDNWYAENVQVGHYIHQASDNDGTGATKSFFADDDVYYWIHNEVYMGPPDAVSIIGTPHLDYIQYCRKQNNVNQQVPKAVPGNMKLWVEDVLLWTDISGTATEGSVTGVAPSTHLFIDSDTTSSDPYVRPNTCFGFDNIILTGVGFVAQLSKGTRNCFSRISATSAPQIPATWNAGTLRQASGNILFDQYVAASGGTQLIGKLIIRNIDYSTASPPADSAFVDDNGTNLGTNQPQDYFEGTFTQSPGNLMWIFSLPNALSLVPSAFAAALVAQFKPKAGVVGGARFS